MPQKLSNASQSSFAVSARVLRSVHIARAFDIDISAQITVKATVLFSMICMYFSHIATQGELSRYESEEGIIKYNTLLISIRRYDFESMLIKVSITVQTIKSTSPY